MLVPINSGYLPMKDGHEIYFAEYGNQQGIPVLTLHGGPGSHHKPHHVVCFDLDKYRVIAFDQRGCGLSKFVEVLKANTTPKLISDIERLREHLHIKSWFVAGSSWGSTLALAYALAYPNFVLGLLVSSVFLARKLDNDWAFGGSGANRLFPDLWDQTNPNLSALELLHEINSAEISRRNELVAKVLNWEGNLMTSQLGVNFTDPTEIGEEALPMVQISLHYLANNYFLSDNELLHNIAKIKDLPTIIVHGRYDVLCPTDGAYALAQSLVNSELIILPNSNHKFTADGVVAQSLAYNKFLLTQGVPR